MVVEQNCTLSACDIEQGHEAGQPRHKQKGRHRFNDDKLPAVYAVKQINPIFGAWSARRVTPHDASVNCCAPEWARFSNNEKTRGRVEIYEVARRRPCLPFRWFVHMDLQGMARRRVSGLDRRSGGGSVSVPLITA
jgi:hypothetical protein